MLEGYRKKEERRFQNEWEMTRWLAFRIAAPPISGSPKKPTVKLKDFALFPWEKSEMLPPMSKEEFEKTRKAWGL